MPPVSTLRPIPLERRASHQFDAMTEGPSDPIELPDHEGIARPHMIPSFGQSGPVSYGPTTGILIKPFTAGTLQGITL